MTVEPINPAKVCKQLEKIEPGAWHPSPYGADGWRFIHSRHKASVIVSHSPADHNDDGTQYVHASVGRPDKMPTYKDLTVLHATAFGDQWAYQMFAPREHHVNIHHNVLHLWGRADGRPMMPNFGSTGTI